MARQRDYRAEYQRRIARGLSRGLSRSQARGHGKPAGAPRGPQPAPQPQGEARRRDYAAEYQRRLERAQERGLSPSQARGHPRPGEPSAREVRDQIRVIAMLHERGELSSDAPGYSYATSIIDGEWAPPGSDLFYARAIELAREMAAEVRYAYSVLLGSP